VIVDCDCGLFLAAEPRSGGTPSIFEFKTQ
jgi:hypothetical protein